MSFKGTVERYAVWETMAIVERASWVTVVPSHPQAVPLGQVRADGWDVPPLASVGGPADDSGVPVVVSSVQGPAEGRKIVGREEFDATLGRFKKEREDALLRAKKDGEKANADMRKLVDAVKDPAVKAALKAIMGGA